MKSAKKIYLILFLALFPFVLKCEYLEVKCKAGDGVTVLLKKYFLPVNDYYVVHFKELNKGKLNKNDDLFLGTLYKLPVKIYKFDKKSIRTTLGISSYEDAKAIQTYNEKLVTSNKINRLYTKSGKLYVPLEYLNAGEKDNKIVSDKPDTKPSVKDEPRYFNTKLFGKNYQNVEIKDNELQGRYYYISSGHGGCDPGAVGNKDGYVLCEDEYAYDVSLRVARGLLEHSANVYMILQDPNDGIRDDNYLLPDNDEYFYGNDTISTKQTERLNKRTVIMNNLYEKNKAKAKSQTTLIIHLDSRYQDKRIDIFYYHKKDDPVGKEIAKTLYQTIKEKYAANQPGRGYYGTIESRDLLELRKTKANAVYIELGNIQNPNDQIRFIDPNNRQAIANWIVLGLIKQSKK